MHGRIHYGFEHNRNFSNDAEDNKESTDMGKITTTYNASAFLIEWYIYPAFGGDFSGSTTLNHIQSLAEKIQMSSYLIRPMTP